MADTTVMLNESDPITSGTVGILWGRVEVSSELFLASRNPEVLERLADAALEAARDLRLRRLTQTCDGCGDLKDTPLVSKGVEKDGVVNTVSLCSPCAFEDWGADVVDEAVGW